MNHFAIEPAKKKQKQEPVSSTNSNSNMASCVMLGLWNADQIQRIKIDNVDFDSKVEVFKNQAIKALNGSMPNIELSFCGVILDNENTLSSYGVVPGVTIHIVQKSAPKYQKSEKKMTESEIVNSFRTITLFNEYRSILQRLTRKEVIDKVLEATPGLEGDPVALAIIQDPELLIYLSQPETVTKLAKEHPILLEAAPHILALVHEDQTNSNPNHASTSTGYSYSLEALSDDDDMDSTSESNISQNPLTRNTSFNAITAAQLASAIANATNTQFNTYSAGVPTATNSSNNIITNEMFSNAIQQAFAGSGGNTGMLSPSTPSGEDEERSENMETMTRRWESQLQQMHEMGLINDAINVRALQATNGDVSTAIELVLSMNSIF